MSGVWARRRVGPARRVQRLPLAWAAGSAPKYFLKALPAGASISAHDGTLVHQFWEDLGVTRETLLVGSRSAGWVSVYAMTELSGAEVWLGVSSRAQLSMP